MAQHDVAVAGAADGDAIGERVGSGLQEPLQLEAHARGGGDLRRTRLGRLGVKRRSEGFWLGAVSRK